MARAEAGSAKFQSKALKASGLQKLKYYCQLCQKQCRDANGFKSHLGSPSHLGRISNLSKDGKGSSVVQEYLREFEREFLRLLKINHGTKKIDANKFYQEYILYDKNHVHMNATSWTSLTSFVKHLGQLGKVRVDTNSDADEFNLQILYVDEMAASSNKNTREKQLRTDEESLAKFVNAQVEAGKKLEEEYQKEAVKKPETVKTAPAAKMALSLKGLKLKRGKSALVFQESDEE